MGLNINQPVDCEWYMQISQLIISFDGVKSA